MPRAGGGASAAKVLPIDVPAFPLAELNRLTGNFGDRALVGEGSYGRVYRAKFASGELVAVKMFDKGSSSGQSEAEFCEQLSVVSRLKCDHFTPSCSATASSSTTGSCSTSLPPWAPSTTYSTVC